MSFGANIGVQPTSGLRRGGVFPPATGSTTFHPRLFIFFPCREASIIYVERYTEYSPTHFPDEPSFCRFVFMGYICSKFKSQMKLNLPHIAFEITDACNLNCLYCYNIWKMEDPIIKSLQL